MAGSKLRTFRSVEDGRWDAASERAAREGTSVTAVLNDALRAYAQASSMPSSGAVPDLGPSAA